jgi:HK97 family phage major capsid protein
MSQELIKAISDLSSKIDETQKKTEGQTQKHLDQAQKEANELKEQLKKLQDEQTTKHNEFVKKLEEKDATIGQIQAEVKDIKAKGGRPGNGAAEKIKTIWQIVSETIIEAKDKIVKGADEKKLIDTLELKTVANISSANNSANYLNYLDWQPGMEPLGQNRFRDFVRTILSENDFVSFPRANTPIGEGSFNRQTEAAAKQQVDRDYTMITLTLKPMAGYAVCSRQSLRNIPFLSTWLPTSMLEQLMDSEDTDFANSLVAAANASTSVAGVTVAVEKVIHLIKNLRKAKYNPTDVLIDPDKWAEILLTKPSNYSIPNAVVITPQGNVTVLGRKMTEVNWLTGGRCLVGDFTKAAIVQSEGLTLRQSDSHASLFTTNEIAFLIERTEGLAIFRTDAFSTLVL